MKVIDKKNADANIFMSIDILLLYTAGEEIVSTSKCKFAEYPNSYQFIIKEGFEYIHKTDRLNRNV